MSRQRKHKQWWTGGKTEASGRFVVARIRDPLMGGNILCLARYTFLRVLALLNEEWEAWPQYVRGIPMRRQPHRRRPTLESIAARVA